MADWIQEARGQLLAVGQAGGGWGYAFRGPLSVEPTALACLAFLATTPGPNDPAAPLVASLTLSLSKHQKPDGSVGVGADIPKNVPQPNWTTAHALLLWATQKGFEDSRAKAAQWLLGFKGVAFEKVEGSLQGHDTSLVGWPWIAGTHSWLEPTAMAVLALRREGKVDHPRVQEGLKLIQDRAVPTGGWNYGNSTVFGNTLRAQPAPTGQALLALAGAVEETDVVKAACDYLLKTLPTTRAQQSLAWGLLGLTAWGRRPSDADGWLEESYRKTLERRDPPYLVSLQLLAGSDKTLALLGLTPPADGRAE